MRWFWVLLAVTAVCLSVLWAYENNRADRTIDRGVNALCESATDC